MKKIGQDRGCQVDRERILSGLSPNPKNKLPGRLPLSDRAFAFLVTPKLLFAQEK